MMLQHCEWLAGNARTDAEKHPENHPEKDPLVSYGCLLRADYHINLTIQHLSLYAIHTDFSSFHKQSTWHVHRS